MHVLLFLVTFSTTTLLAICSGQEHTISPLPPICFCPATRFCRKFTVCPYGLKLEYSGPCRCCSHCVIPKNGKCPYYVLLPFSNPIDSISCEDGTKCYNGICTENIHEIDSTTTEESTTVTETN